MIEEIRIADLGVIGRAHVELGPGLTVLTGETGAGKTMVLTALGLLLGGKADPATVRAGAAAASVEGRVLLAGAATAGPARGASDGAAMSGGAAASGGAAVPADGVGDRSADGGARAEAQVLARALEAGAELDEDGTLVLARTVTAGADGGPGRSRAYVGGRSVPQGVLGELADALVTVHGQADQARLRSPAHQREALDAYAGGAHQGRLAAYREAWAQRARVDEELAGLVERAQDRAREAELLRLGLAEVERVDPQPGEDVALAEEAERLAHAEDLRAAAVGAHAALAGDDDGVADVSAAAAVEHARRLLEQAGGHDPALAGLAGRVAEAGYLLADAATELSAYLDGLDADPLRLDAVQQRRAELATLTRSYGNDVAEVLAWAEASSRRLLDLDAGDQRIADLRAHRAELDERLTALAAEVSAVRAEAAGRLAAAVTEELAGLAMALAELRVVVEPADEPGPHGADRVEMLLVPHAGAPARPLGRGASGGELSRVMLALEVALATAPDSARPGTFVFDEVDAGVGGRAAVEVGRRLARLARGSQVLVVTHLAQVAAFADRHLVVTKSAADGADVVTESDVRAVEDDDRVRELARMLSGQDDSQTALAHAAELLAQSVVGR